MILLTLFQYLQLFFHIFVVQTIDLLSKFNIIWYYICKYFFLKIMKIYILLFILTSINSSSKLYLSFDFPLYLSRNFWVKRDHHFHTGVDVKTSREEFGYRWRLINKLKFLHGVTERFFISFIHKLNTSVYAHINLIEMKVY